MHRIQSGRDPPAYAENLQISVVLVTEIKYNRIRFSGISAASLRMAQGSGNLELILADYQEIQYNFANENRETVPDGFL